MTSYFDYAATAPIEPEAKQAYLDALEVSGNASTLHRAGQKARAIVEDSREIIAEAVGAHSSEIIFTSGGTEADNLSLKGLFWQSNQNELKKPYIMISEIEHPAVIETAQWLEEAQGAHILWIPVDSQGVVNLEFIEKILKEKSDQIALISVMWANNEIGTIEPVNKITELAAHYGVSTHSDAVQAIGNVPVDFKKSGLKMMSISGHKLGAPVGVGALVVSRDIVLTPVQHGGGHERFMRSGTINVASICAFAAVMSKKIKNLKEENARLRTLREYAKAQIAQLVPEAQLQGSPDDADVDLEDQTRLPGNLHYTFPGAQGDSLLFMLDTFGIESSTGAACTAGVPKPSHVLLSLGISEDDALGAQRFTFGQQTNKDDIDKLLEALPKAYENARKAGSSARVSSIETPRMYGMGS